MTRKRRALISKLIGNPKCHLEPKWFWGALKRTKCTWRNFDSPVARKHRHGYIRNCKTGIPGNLWGIPKARSTSAFGRRAAWLESSRVKVSAPRAWAWLVSEVLAWHHQPIAKIWSISPTRDQAIPRSEVKPDEFHWPTSLMTSDITEMIKSSRCDFFTLNSSHLQLHQITCIMLFKQMRVGPWDRWTWATNGNLSETPMSVHSVSWGWGPHQLQDLTIGLLKCTKTCPEHGPRGEMQVTLEVLTSSFGVVVLEIKPPNCNCKHQSNQPRPRHPEQICPCPGCQAWAAKGAKVTTHCMQAAAKTSNNWKNWFGVWPATLTGPRSK